MAVITPNEFKRGMSILHRDSLWEIVEYYRQRTGKRKPYVVTRLRNLETGRVLEETFSANEKIEHAFIERRPMEYLYRAGGSFVLMDQETYEQPEFTEAQMESIAELLKEGTTVQVTSYEDRVIGVSLPDFVELAVSEAPPHLRGDTATSEYREVTLETGAKIKAPPFVSEGDVIQIDTRTREYVKRVDA